MYTADMFDFSGKDKLNSESIEYRESIIAHHAKNPHCLFFCSHSGGKDSQAMYETIKKLVPASQIVVVHAHLGRAEHNGVLEHITNTVDGHDVHVVKNPRKDFIDMVLLRNMFPSPQYRQCTSDLKTTQIDKLIRKIMKERGANVGFNCIGLRAEESNQRAARNPLWINTRLTLKPNKKGVVARTVYDWMPVFHLEFDEVFDVIYNAGKQAHPAYGHRGSKNRRLSCVLCIMACKNDLVNGATDYPDLYNEYLALEVVTGHTMFCKTVQGSPVPVSLEERVGIPRDDVAVQRHIKRLVVRKAELEAAKTLEANEKAQKKAIKAMKPTSKKRDDLTIEMFA